MCQAFIGAFGYHDIATRTLDELADDEQSSAIIKTLSRGGFEQFRELTGDWGAAARTCVSATLRKAKLDAGDVDAIVVVSEGMPPMDGADASTSRLFRGQFLDQLIDPLGLYGARLYGTWMSACGNFATALNIANGLTMTGMHRNVLVVIVELARGIPRMLDNPLALLSDIVGSFMLSTKTASDYVLGPIRAHSALQLASQPMRTNSFMRGNELMAALAEFKAQLDRDDLIGPLLASDLPVLVDNLHHQMLEIVAYGLGISADRLWPATRELFGHSFSGDLLVSLNAIGEGVIEYDHDVILALNIGPWSFAAMHLRPGVQSAE